MRYSFDFISNDTYIQEYVEKIAIWIQEHTILSPEEVYVAILTDKERITRLFEPYPETVTSQDPAKWADLLSCSWGILEEQPLEFV